MTKQKKKQKRSIGCGFPLIMLVLLCLFVAVAYWKPKIPLPESAQKPAEELIDRVEARWGSVKSALSDRFSGLKEKLPEKEEKPKGEAPEVSKPDEDAAITEEFLPESVQKPAEELFDRVEEQWGNVKSALSDRFSGLMEKLPEKDEKPQEEVPEASESDEEVVITMDSLPEYAGEPYVILYGNQPSFSEQERTSAQAYEVYSELDLLGRCGAAKACIGTELMPTEERGAIGMVKPSGWHTVRYDDLVDGKYLYNRCHLIGYQLSGENANEMNLITGTRYMNVVGMLPFENQVADYVHQTGNHVMYRVTPDFRDEELLARGVQIEAWGVEDNGDGICFNVYCYNVQPGVEIRYLDGESHRAEENGV